MTVNPESYIFMNFHNRSKQSIHFSIASGLRTVLELQNKVRRTIQKYLISQFEGESDLNEKPILKDIYNSSEI